jgi:8-oxo-dGTP pyrophosphatase MutT (NUDIX family)
LTIAQALATSPPEHTNEIPPDRKAAVAAVLRPCAVADGAAELLFIRRAEHPRDPWSGHMALPGGRIDPTDPNPVATAIREAREEVALDLASDARLLGGMTEVRTHLRRNKVPYSVLPFVFALERNPPLRPNEEVQEALWVPLTFFVDRDNRRSMTWMHNGVPLPLPCYHWGKHVIWGLTLRIVDNLLALVSKAA